MAIFSNKQINKQEVEKKEKEKLNTRYFLSVHHRDAILKIYIYHCQCQELEEHCYKILYLVINSNYSIFFLPKFGFAQKKLTLKYQYQNNPLLAKP